MGNPVTASSRWDPAAIRGRYRFLEKTNRYGITPSATLSCAVERRFPVAGANSAQHLSLQLVADTAYYGGSDMV